MELAIWQKCYLIFQNVARLLLFHAAVSRVCNVAFATSAAWHPLRVWSVHCSTLSFLDRFEWTNSSLIFCILLCVNALRPPNHSIPSVQYRCMQFGTHLWSCDKKAAWDQFLAMSEMWEWPAHSLRPAVSIYKGAVEIQLCRTHSSPLPLRLRHLNELSSSLSSLFLLFCKLYHTLMMF